MSRPRHRDLLIIVGYVAAVLFAGALLAPLLFAGGKWLLRFSQDHGWDQIKSLAWFMEPLRKTEFPGYFDRSALIVALLGLWPLMKLLGVRWSEATGTVRAQRGWRQLAGCFVIAVIVLAAMSALSCQLGATRLNAKPAWGAIGAPLISGLVVGCLEEFLFRGAMLGILQRSLGARSAVFWTTVIFAALHFLKPPAHGSIADADVTWSSGFWIVTQLFSGFSRGSELLAEFALLVGVGWVLARARLATDGLWAGIGLHAGWVAGMKYFGQLAKTTDALKHGNFTPWLAENHCKAIVSPVVGFVPLIAVVLTGMIALRICKARPRA